MKRQLLILMTFVFLILSILTLVPVQAEEYGIVPVEVQAALFLKILKFNNDIAKGGEVSIYVLNSQEFADEMNKAIGRKIGNSTLTAINTGFSVPEEKPSVVYIGDSDNIEDILNYTRSNKVLSITGIPDMISKGVTLGVGVSGGKPKVLLNYESLKLEKVNMDPAIHRIAKVIK